MQMEQISINVCVCQPLETTNDNIVSFSQLPMPDLISTNIVQYTVHYANLGDQH